MPLRFKPVNKNLWNNFGDVLGSTFLHPQYFIKIAERRCLEEVKILAKGTFLDIGCGRQWYRKELEPYFDKYYGLDHPGAFKRYQSLYPVELRADATNIPLTSESVDIAMMIMVLEHLGDPEKALTEAKRVLRKDGTLVICTVENYPGHDLPLNFYHFTKFGLRQMLERHGFKVKKLISFGNFWETQVVFQNVYLMQIIKKLVNKNQQFFAVILLLLFTPVMILGNIFAIILGRRLVGEEYALAHLVVASKSAK